MTIANNTVVTNQPAFLNGYLSDIVISNLIIYNITTSNRVISSIDSRLTFTDSNILDIYSSSSGDFISISFESHAIMSNLTYTNSTAEFYTVLLSSLEFTNLQLSNMAVNDYLFSMIDCTSAIIQNIVISNINSTRDSMVLLSGSSIDSISNLTISESNVTSLHILKSNVTSMNLVEISHSRQSIHFEQSQVDLLEQSQFSY